MVHIEDLYSVFRKSEGISTDTRQSQHKKLFVALKGDRFDGNDYALRALSQGAIGAVVDRKELKRHPGCYYFTNTLTALQRLAYHHRQNMMIPVIAITGTNGKTTTKELLASILSQKYVICATQGNLNNHIGVPLTLLQIRESTEVAIVEMGANHPGEIGWLCQIATPSMGLVTNVAEAHLEGFGDIGNIWETKMDLYRYLESRRSLVMINEDELSLRPLRDVDFTLFLRYSRSLLPQGLSVSFENFPTTVGVTLNDEKEFRGMCAVKIYGRHNWNNLLSAIAISAYLKVSSDDILNGLSRYESRINRSQVVFKDTNTFYLDAYNANPTSMKMALEFLSDLEAPKKIAILGDMMELGSQSHVLHQEIVDLAIHAESLDQIFFVGTNFAEAIEGQYMPDRFKSFNDAKAVSEYLRNSRHVNTHFLVKGSRSMKLETILQ